MSGDRYGTVVGLPFMKTLPQPDGSNRDELVVRVKLDKSRKSVVVILADCSVTE